MLVGEAPADSCRDADGRMTYVLVVDAHHADKITEFAASIPCANYYAISPTSSCGQPVQNDHLSERLEQVLRMIGQGKSNKLIGRDLGISHVTVRNHVSRLLRLSGVSNRDELVSRIDTSGMA